MPNELDNLISVFKDTKTTTPKESITIREMLNRIQSGYYSDFVNDVRSGVVEKIKAEAFTLSGTFNKRNANELDKYSGLIQIDIDKVENLSELRAKLINDKYSVFVLTSIGGKGLKLAWRITQEQHTAENFKQIESYFKNTYNVEIDKAVKDIARLFFISYDSDLLINDKAEAFNFKVVKTTEKRETKKVVGSQNDYWYNKALETAANIITQSIKGNRHNSRLRAGYLLGGYIAGGLLDENTAINELRGVIQSNTTLNIEVAMKTFMEALNNGKNKPITKEDYSNNRNRFIETENEIINIYTGELIRKFWKVGKDKIEILLPELYNIISDFGYMLYRHDKNDKTIDYQFIKVENNIVELVNLEAINKHLGEYISILPDDLEGLKKYDLETKMLKGLQSYLTKTLAIHRLKEFDGGFSKDKDNESYFYFKNGFIVANKSGWIFKSYSELEGYIWKTQIKQHTIKALNTEKDFEAVSNFEFVSFCRNICSNKKNDFHKDRFNALISGLGYALHDNNSLAQKVALVFCEANPDIEKSEGGTGKGILLTAIGCLRNIAQIDGKQLEDKNRFAFQKVKLSTQIMLLQDVEKTFNFERLYSAITDGLQVEKKNKEQFTFEANNSPKIIITSNYAIKGNSTSDKRRRHEIELSNYYNLNLTPADEFGRRFFDDWTADDWNLFYNFMFSCVSVYLKILEANNFKSGLLAYENNTELKRFITDTGQDFYDFAVREIKTDITYVTPELRNKFYDYYGYTTKVYTERRFAQSVKKFADFMKYEYTETTKNNHRAFYCKAVNTNKD